MGYRILIADDEVKIIQLIQELGHWEALNMDIVAVCNDGEEAYQRILELKPDIVLTDIKMPVIDGIEMIKRTKAAGIDTHFIVISGFRHFEYARSAISLGVVDYLLKPLDEEQLNKTLLKTCQMIDERNKQTDTQEQLEQYIELDKAEAMERFWEVLVDGEDMCGVIPDDLEECNRVFKTQFKEGYFRCVFIATTIDSLLSGKESLFSEKIYDGFETIFGNKFIYYACVRQRGIILVINYDKGRQELVKQSISALYYNIKNLTEIYGDFVLNIGVSMTKNCVKALKAAMQEAFTAEWGRLVYLGDKVLEYDTIRNLPRFGLRDILTTQMELDLCSYVRYFQLEQVGDVFGEMFKGAAKYENYYPGDMRYFIRYLLNLLLVMHSEGDDEAQEALKLSFIVSCRSVKNFQQMIRAFYLFLDDYLKGILKKMHEKKGKPVEDAKKYIENHYGENISQETIARMLQLSPTYFSKIFKAEMNIGFAEYIVQVRLEKARELLLTTNDSVKEIAYKVGYTDDKYFSKLFKKQIGIKPTEFRKLYAD